MALWYRARSTIGQLQPDHADAQHEDGGWVSLLDLVGRLDDSRIRRMREDLKAVGLDKEIEANGHKSYRLAIEPRHISFEREAIARVPDLEAVAKQIP